MPTESSPQPACHCPHSQCLPSLPVPNNRWRIKEKNQRMQARKATDKSYQQSTTSRNWDKRVRYSPQQFKKLTEMTSYTLTHHSLVMQQVNLPTLTRARRNSLQLLAKSQNKIVQEIVTTTYTPSFLLLFQHPGTKNPLIDLPTDQQ